MTTGDDRNGDIVNLYGDGDGGTVHHHAPPRPTLEQALEQVVRCSNVVRAAMATHDRTRLDAALWVLNNPAAAPAERGRSLLAIADVAAALGGAGYQLEAAVEDVRDFFPR